MMIRPGVCSLTLPRHTPGEVIRAAVSAELQGIEWWGKAHVPPGDLCVAREVARQTRDAGLAVSTYGSYYRVGISEPAGQPFQAVLDSALALGTPMIRVWAGDKDRSAVDDAYVAQVIGDAERIAELASAARVAITFEFHGGTLTHTSQAAIDLAAALQHPAVHFSWQPTTGMSIDECTRGLRALLPRLATVHVFNWTPGDKGAVRHPLADGLSAWRAYFAAVAQTGREHWALLEFVRDDSLEQFSADARVLRQLLAAHAW